MKYKIKKADGTYALNTPMGDYTGVCNLVAINHEQALREGWRIVRIKTVKKPSKMRQALDIALKAIKNVDESSMDIDDAEHVVRTARREIKRLGVEV